MIAHAVETIERGIKVETVGETKPLDQAELPPKADDALKEQLDQMNEDAHADAATEKEE